ncbi:MAG: DUF4340 domain-containing protein [Bythopirellula sp.]|nr:DUF4340 domain-containing protein [Bythopirellula sp.]
MSEMAKTLAFMAAGAVALLAAFVVVPTENSFDADELVGQRLNQFEVDAPKRLKIIKFDEETATPREFEVAEENGLWEIPSKEDYPADATKEMAEAATCVIDREILRVATTSAAEHAQMGVLDPSSAKLKSQADGTGIRVVMTDNNNSVLTDMIVGKAVKDAEGQHYVRNTDQDIVYVVNIDPKKLSTRFEDWIEGDLLKISPFDIRQVDIKDYSAELMLTLQGYQARWEPRAEMILDYDNTDSKWKAESLKKFDTTSKKYVDFAIPEGEALNEEALNKMRDGLDDLAIVDVVRKPAGLSADLKAGTDFIKDDEAAEDLMARGFAPIANAETKQADILSTEGEVVCSLQDGVEYVLRFGNIPMDSDEAEGKTDESADEESDKKKSDDGVNRYMFVMARFNEGMIEKPELDELPKVPAEAEEKEAGETASDVESGEEGSESDGEVAAATGEEAEGEEPTADAKPPAAEDEAKKKEREDILAARKEIELENLRRTDEYQAKIKEGQEKVAELNERFGDWYYVISNDVYQQVHLGLDKVVQKKVAEGDKAAEGAEAAAGGIPGMPNLPFANPPAAQ